MGFDRRTQNATIAASMAKIFHPLLALIASGTDRKLAKYVEFTLADVPLESPSPAQSSARLLVSGRLNLEIGA